MRGVRARCQGRQGNRRASKTGISYQRYEPKTRNAYGIRNASVARACPSR